MNGSGPGWWEETEEEKRWRKVETWLQSTHNRLGMIKQGLDQIFGALVVLWVTLVVALVSC